MNVFHVTHFVYFLQYVAIVYPTIHACHSARHCQNSLVFTTVPLMCVVYETQGPWLDPAATPGEWEGKYS